LRNCTNHPRAGALRGAALLALGVAVGGACARFVPSVPVRARTGDVALDLDEVRVGVGRQIVYRSTSTTPHQLRRGWLTVPSREPCSGGAEATAVVVDEGLGPEGALPAGPHEVHVHLPQADGFSLDTVIDLELEEGTCVRVPAVSQSVPLEPRRRVTLVVSTGLVGNTDLAGLRGVVGFEAGLGGWAGPVLLSGQLGLGATMCNAGTCGKDDHGNLKGGLAVPLALDARVSLGSAAVNRLRNFAFLGARYSFASVSLPARDGDRSFGVHGLYGVLSWAFGDVTPGPFRHHERGPVCEFAIPVGAVFAPSLAGKEVGFSGGFDLRFLFPL
jgi:hypothetical protein